MSAMIEPTKAISQPDCAALATMHNSGQQNKTHNGNAYRPKPERVACNVAKTETFAAAIAGVCHVHLLQRRRLSAAEADHMVCLVIMRYTGECGLSERREGERACRQLGGRSASSVWLRWRQRVGVVSWRWPVRRVAVAAGV